MKPISISNAVALLNCISNVPGNITVTEISDTQRAYSINETGERFINAINGIQTCLDMFNVTGSTTYIDVQRTRDTELMDWAQPSVDIDLDHTSSLIVNNATERNHKSNMRGSDGLSKRYLDNENINLRGYEAAGCNNYMLWNLDNYGVHGNCIDTVPTPITKSLGYDYPWHTDQLWAQTSPHHECRPKSSADGKCHDDRSITSLDMTNAQCWKKMLLSTQS